MARVAYRFLPCDEEGIPREHSQYTLVADAAEIFSTGSVIDSGVLGVAKWQVVEVREEAGPLRGARDSDGSDLVLGGTLVCRALGCHSSTTGAAERVVRSFRFASDQDL